ncbi:MAG: hypothetical protein R3B96_11555 [Pirellulaceae bacterium]
MLDDADHFKCADVPQGVGQGIHRRGFSSSSSGVEAFCVSCHQVAVYPQIKLEVVWDQYIASPAYREGISCQDCHMGKIPGLAEGYSVRPAAIIEGKPVLPERKHSNHGFYGPGYSVAHPGLPAQREGRSVDDSRVVAVRLASWLGHGRLRGSARAGRVPLRLSTSLGQRRQSIRRMRGP